jgi:gluconate 5-dehydrogenase
VGDVRTTPASSCFNVDRILLKRPGIPHDLDGAIVFLASDDSEYVTGQNLLIDGGITTGSPRAMSVVKP